MSQGCSDVPVSPISLASSSSEAGTEAKACWKVHGNHPRDSSGADLYLFFTGGDTDILTQEMPLKFSLVLYWHGHPRAAVNMSCMRRFGAVMLTELPDVQEGRRGACLWRPLVLCWSFLRSLLSTRC